MDTSTLLPPAAAQAAPGRLNFLFRGGLRHAQVHPLLSALRLHRGQWEDEPVPPAPLPPPPAPDLPRLQPEDVRRCVAELPPLPQAALRALTTLRREDASLTDVAEHLSVDASLTARVMRLANSPFYGVPGRVACTRDAAQVLGRRTLENVLTLASVADRFQGCRSRLFRASAFWRHALGTALAAQGLARRTGLDAERAFAAGLLHDIGLLAMSVYFPQALDALFEQARAADEEHSSAERRLGLTSHADVGAWIAEHWLFPPAVVQAIALHHGSSGERDGLADCVHLANAIAHGLDLAGLPHEMVPALDAAAWQRAALDAAGLGALFTEVESGVQSLCAAMSV